MKRLVIGILAHVDAGKTTLSESMLYLSGKIKEMGRLIIKMPILIRMRWSGSGESQFFFGTGPV